MWRGLLPVPDRHRGEARCRVVRTSRHISDLAALLSGEHAEGPVIHALGWLLLLGAFLLDVGLEQRRAERRERWSTGAIRAPMSGVVWVYVAFEGRVWRGAWDGVGCSVQWVGDVSEVPAEVLDEAEGKAIQRVGWAA